VASWTYRAIGCFIHGFSLTESALRVFLADKIKLDAKFHNAVMTHDFSLLCTAILEVYRETTKPEIYDRLKKLISRLREFNDLRVKVVHGEWMPEEDGGTLLHISRQSLNPVRNWHRRHALELAQPVDSLPVLTDSLAKGDILRAVSNVRVSLVKVLVQSHMTTSFSNLSDNPIDLGALPSRFWWWLWLAVM
jgi:hypothetical protein